MSGACIIVVPDRRQRADLLKVAQRLGLDCVVNLAEPYQVDGIFEVPMALRLAIVAVDSSANGALGLVSRLCVNMPECLVIAVDAADTEDSAARAFAAGAHDVLRMPLRPSEAAARITRGLARMAPAQARQVEATVNGMIGKLDLKQAEANILRIFSANLGQIVTRDALSQELYGTPWQYGDRRFDVYVTRIRRKLRQAYPDRLELRTIRSVGYTLEYLVQAQG
ncbi:winged helix-turn-helix domain-containing protein [Seohaeicola zhoushanensis]|uniref:DNA-binding response regulator n=1 Tax=Seohaeicola zhoushanensis TaxID=1569283 RepID=A0A8J3GUI6_9RHOB|nr:winged helix-turn-helix domain-containing protein [Seohaeicola zhoushanensis]GHF36156.1 DNA-binding response regulator [Seohaeicola zhoushanensis]